MSADTKQETSQDSENTSQAKGTNVDAELASVKAQLAELIESQKATMNAIASQRQTEVVQEQEEENLYDPNTLIRKTERIIDQKLQSEQARNAKIAELSREYPEISTDTKLMSEIVAAQRELPESIRNEAAGYEAAILKVVAKNAILPKSRRQTVDDDIAMGGSSGETRQRERRGKVKLSEATLRLAELMGNDTSDPEYLKRLEASAQRTDWKRYK